MNIQALVNGLSAQWQRERAASQMTLGGLIAALEQMPSDAQVVNLAEPRSYRGYYCDLAFTRRAGTRLAAELLQDCKNAMGRTFEGYKGGDYVMGELTPLWVAEYGDCGDRLMSMDAQGAITTEPEDE